MALAGVALAGCATPPEKTVSDPALLMEEQFSFIRDGAVSREQILLRLGPPTAVFEDGRIFAYQLTPMDNGKWWLSAPGGDPSKSLRYWAPMTCNLMLVFGSDGVLERHTLVLPDEFARAE